jgi:hypothetical protein
MQNAVNAECPHRPARRGMNCDAKTQSTAKKCDFLGDRLELSELLRRRERGLSTAAQEPNHPDSRFAFLHSLRHWRFEIRCSLFILHSPATQVPRHRFGSRLEFFDNYLALLRPQRDQMLLYLLNHWIGTADIKVLRKLGDFFAEVLLINRSMIELICCFVCECVDEAFAKQLRELVF